MIDTNVLIAGLLRESIVREILLSENIKFFLPDYSLIEINKYKKDLCEKSDYSEEEFDLMLECLLENIELIPKEEIKGYMEEAKEVMKNIDIKDSSFIATCFSTSSDGIWTFDSHFNQQDKVRIFSTKELANLQ